MLFNINGRGYREIKYSYEKSQWEKRDVAKEMENIRVGVKLMPTENNQGNLLRLRWENATLDSGNRFDDHGYP